MTAIYGIKRPWISSTVIKYKYVKHNNNIWIF